MNTIGLLVGEDADLPTQVRKNLPISIFTYTVNFSSAETSSSFYYGMRQSHTQTPTTSQPSIKVFKELFESNLAKYQDLIVITISSHVSGTYNAANQAKKLLPEQQQKRIYIIDSQSSSGGEALLALKALKLISLGTNITAVVNLLKTSIPTISFIGVFDDPQWLQKGGRINAIQATLVKNMLKTGFRPILTIRDGQIVTKKIQMNAKDKASALFHQFIQELTASNSLAKHISVVITHSDCEKDAIQLKSMIENSDQTITIKFINTISPVIGAHLGPDALLLAWVAE